RHYSSQPSILRSFPTRRSSDLQKESCHVSVCEGICRGQPRRDGFHLRRCLLQRHARFQPSHDIQPMKVAALDQKSSRWRESKERSEEHTSELQSLAYLVCRLLL